MSASLFSQLEAAEFNTSPLQPRSSNASGLALKAANDTNQLLPSAAELGLVPKAMLKAAPQVSVMVPQAWNGVAALSDENISSETIVTSPTPAPLKPAAAVPAPRELPSILPAHELERSLRHSKEGAQTVVPHEAKVWSGISNSMADSADMYEYTVQEPARLRGRSDEPLQFGKEEVADKKDMLPSAVELGLEARKPSTSLSTASSMAKPAVWQGISNQTEYDEMHVPSPSPPSRRARSRSHDEAAPVQEAKKPVLLYTDGKGRGIYG